MCRWTPKNHRTAPDDRGGIRYLGTHQVVYLKAGTCDGAVFFVIHGADGASLVAVEDLETAMAMVAEQGFSSSRFIEARPALALSMPLYGFSLPMACYHALRTGEFEAWPNPEHRSRRAGLTTQEAGRRRWATMQELARMHTPAAIEALVAALGVVSTRVAAAVALLERGWESHRRRWRAGGDDRHRSATRRGPEGRAGGFIPFPRFDALARCARERGRKRQQPELTIPQAIR